MTGEFVHPFDDDLFWAKVEFIKNLLDEGRLSQRQIGETIGVSQTYVSQVKLGKLKWVDDQ